MRRSWARLRTAVESQQWKNKTSVTPQVLYRELASSRLGSLSSHTVAKPFSTSRHEADAEDEKSQGKAPGMSFSSLGDLLKNQSPVTQKVAERDGYEHILDNFMTKLESERFRPASAYEAVLREGERSHQMNEEFFHRLAQAVFSSTSRRPDVLETVMGYMEENGVRPSFETYKCLLRMYRFSGNMSKLTAAFAKLEEAGYEADTESYNEFLWFYCSSPENANIDRAWEWLEMMDTANVSPNADTLALLLRCMKNAECDIDELEAAWSRFMEKYEHVEPTLPCYHAVLSLLSREGDSEAVDAWVRRLLQRGVQPDTVTLNLRLKALLLSGATRTELQDAFDAFQSLGVSPDSETVHMMIESFAKRGEFVRVMDWVNRMEHTYHIPLTSRTYELVAECIKAQPGEGNTRFQELFEEVKSKGLVVSSSMYRIAIQKCSEEGDNAGVDLWYKRLKQKHMVADDFTLAALLRAYGRQRRDRDMIAELEEARSKTGGDFLLSHTALIAHFCRQGLVEEAEKWWGEMVAAGGELGVTQYNYMIDGYSRVGDQEKISVLLDQMHAANIDANLSTFNIVIGAFASVGDTEGAENWLESLYEHGMKPNDETYIAMMRCFAYCDDSHRLMEMFHAGFSGEGTSPNGTAIAVLIDYYARVGNLEEAEGWAEQCTALNLPLDQSAYTALLSLYSRVGSNDKFEGLLKRLRGELGSNVASFHVQKVVLDHFLNSGEPEKGLDAMKWLHKGKGQIPSVGHISNITKKYTIEPEHCHHTLFRFFMMQNKQNFEAVMSHFLKKKVCLNAYTFSLYLSRLSSLPVIAGGGEKRTLEAFQTMNEVGVKPNAMCFNVILAMYVSMGRHDMVTRVQEFRAMMETAGVQPTSQTYSLLLQAYRKAKKIDLVKEVYQSLVDEREKKHLTEYHSALAIAALGECGLVSEAEDVFRQVVRLHGVSKTLVWNALLDAYAGSPDPENPAATSAATIIAIPSDAASSAPLSNASVSQFSSVLNRMLLDNVEMDHHTYGTVVRFFSRSVSHLPQAQNWYMKTLIGVEQGDLTEVLPETTIALLDAYIANNMYSNVDGLVRGHLRHDVPLSEEVYCSLLTALGKKGRVDEAVQVLMLMRASETSMTPNIFDVVVKLHLSNGDVEGFRNEVKIYGSRNGSFSQQTHEYIILYFALEAQDKVETMYWFRRMREWRVRPSLYLFHELISWLVKVDDEKSVLEVMKFCLKVHKRASRRSFDTIIDYYRSKGDAYIDTVLRWRDLMIKLGHRPSSPPPRPEHAKTEALNRVRASKSKETDSLYDVLNW